MTPIRSAEGRGGGRRWRSPAGVVAALLMTVGVLVSAAGPATAAVFFGAGTDLDAHDVTVGDQNVPGTYTVINNSTAPEGTAPNTVTLTSMTFIPACSSNDVVNCAGGADPGVFHIDPVATGQSLTACAGKTFNVTVIDPTTGKVQLTPVGGPVVLGPPGSPSATCIVDFTFDVLKAPVDAEPLMPGLQTHQPTQVTGVSNFNGNAGAGFGQATTTVRLAQPAITTAPTPTTAPVGTPVRDTATLTGGQGPAGPTGTITFRLYGPADATCAGAPVFTSAPVTVAGNGTYTSPPFTPTAASPAGTPYHWVASYSGDANNNPVTSVCANEPLTVTRVTPAITTNASATTQAGGTISDTATLTGGFNPTGTITFTVYGPNNATCAAPPAFPPATVPLTLPTTTSPAFGPVTAPGTYRFIASYSGDANNAPVTSACNAANEAVLVRAVPTLATTASGAGPVGGTVSDTATLTGATATPTGTMTFNVYGPADPTCAGPPLFTRTVPVTGATTPSGAFGPTTAVGTYRFIAIYSGDVNNVAPPPTACSDPAEAVVITRAVPTLATTASGAGPVGGTISDSAVLTGAVNPTGTMTFNVYGPADPTCAGPPLFTRTVPVTGATTPSGAFGPTTAVGTYRFIASYSGDANNVAPPPTACSDPAEAVVIRPATPTLATTASASVPVGGMIHDTATLAGGVNPTGTITFALFGPNNATCAGAPIFTTTTPVAGNGSYDSASFSPTAAGTYRWVATYSGDANNTAPPPTSCADAAEAVVVTKAQPTIVTNTSAAAPAGGPIHDTATLAGGTNPTGTITFTLYGPNDTTCAGPPAFTATIPVSGNGNYDSPNFVVNLAGTYRWRASYSGDANNNPAGPTACADPAEAVVVAKAPPTIVTNASAAVPVGGQIHDTATLSGGVNPTGTITFTLYGPNDATCAGPPASTTTVAVAGNGSYDSPNFTTVTAGTYRWRASYSGDANNLPAGPTACADPAEAVVVTQVPTAITTVASPTVSPGGSVFDTATLTGGTNPTGTITFTLYGPNDATCTGPPAFTTTVAVTHGNGPYPSPSFVVTAPGTYRWRAAYSGDANNAPAGPTACADPAEAVRVRAAPTLATTASATVAVGGMIHDTATLSGGLTPTGTITFRLFGPNNATCAGAPIFTTTAPVAGNGSYDSPSFTTAAAGTYRWTASYSGDANNAPAGPTACADPAEAVVVTAAVSAISTTASPTVAVGGPIHDTATLAAGPNPTGTITFRLFGPNDATCTGPAAFTATVAVTHGNGVYTSPDFTTVTAGTYRWVAAYSGDTNNAPATTACTDAAEAVVVSRLAPAISTTASPAVSVGGQVHDTATLTGGTNPTGTITFNLYGPNDTTCNGPAAFTATVTVNGNGPYPSPSFVVTAPGTYRWRAAYSGDANNAPAGPTSCADPAEAVLVRAAPTLATTASVSVPEGGAIHDTATLSGGLNPTGTITFALFGPNNATCAGAPIFTTTAPVAGNGSYTSADFATQINGPAGPGTYRWIATYSGDANNAPAGPTACTDPAESVVVTGVAPTIRVVKTANPLVRPEPGGTFTFTVVVVNTSAETVTITSLTDNVYGNLNGRGTCAIGAVLAPNGGSYTCTFDGTFTGVGGQSQTDTVTAVAVDHEGQTATAQAQATVRLTTVLPTIAVVKTASPLTRPEPGGTFTFSVVVTNTSFKTLTLTSLVDNVYGDLNGRGTCAVGATLAPNGGTYSCTFDGTFTGVGGQSQTDTVTATGVDHEGNQVSAQASATVSLTAVPPTITVVKTPSPSSLPEPGGTFTFTVTVTNTTFEALNLTTLIDNVYGDLNGKGTCAVPQTLAPAGAPGASYTCHFPGTFTGVGGDRQTDTVTATAVNSRGQTATAQAQATVTLTNVPPSIAVTKTANPTSRPEPGGPFTFTVVVTNTAPTPLTLSSLVDNVYGDLNGKGDCAVPQTLAPAGSPGASYTCHFTGPFTGIGGDTQTDTVTATGHNNRGQQVSAQAQATVRLTPVIPTITVTKTPDPTSRPEPGGPFTFTVVVTNTTPVPLTLTSLVDNVYGDLNGKGDCAVPQTLAAAGSSGDTYTCHFTAPFTGVGGASQTDTVTATARTQAGRQATAKAQATVTLTPVAAPTPIPPPPAPPLVRTGADLAGPARLALALFLAGLLLLAATWESRRRSALHRRRRR